MARIQPLQMLNIRASGSMISDTGKAKRRARKMAVAIAGLTSKVRNKDTENWCWLMEVNILETSMRIGLKARACTHGEMEARIKATGSIFKCTVSARLGGQTTVATTVNSSRTWSGATGSSAGPTDASLTVNGSKANSMVWAGM